MAETSTSLWGRLLAPFRRARAAVQKTPTNRDQPWLYYQYLAHEQAAGVTITMDSALQLSVAWGCIVALSNALSGARWNVFQVDDNGHRTLLPNDPLDYVLNVRPNPDMTPISLKETLIFAVLTWGNGYAEIVRTASGRVVELWPLLPHKMFVRRDPPELGGALFYEYAQQNGGIKRLEAEDVYHLRGPGISGLLGDNLVARAAKTMALAAAQERFASTYYGNNTAIGGVLETPRVLSDEAYERLKTSWEDVHKGPTKAHKIAILESGTKFVSTSNNPTEAQAVESRTLQIEELCRWFGVPPHKVQHLARATFSNIEHLAIEFVRDGVTPWARRMEQEADYKLLSARGPRRRTLLDLSPLTQGDFASRATGYSIMRNIGVYSVNDILHAEGKNGIGPDGDVRIVGVNMQTLERLQLPPAAAADPGAVPENVPTLGGEEAGAQTQARAVAQLAVAGVFDRYVRRMNSRGADLRRTHSAEAQVKALLAAEQEKLKPQAILEVRELLRAAGVDVMGVAAGLDELDAGADPRATVQAMFERSTR